MSQPGGASRNRSRVVAVVAMCAAIVAVAAAVVAVVFKGAGSSSAQGSVTLEAAAVPGVDPFTPLVANGAAPLNGSVTAEGAAVRSSLPTDASTHTRVATGTAPGLYGGSGDVHACDPQQLVAYLSAHQDKAAAWARVLGIDTKDIGRYVATLTPVVLTGDTLVRITGSATVRRPRCCRCCRPVRR